MGWPEVRRYAFAFLMVAVAVLFARAFDRYVAPHVSPLYFLAVMLSAAYAGAGPGLVATVLASLAIAWFDLGSAHRLDLGLDDVVRLTVFIVTALIISSISAARKAAERELRIALDELSATDRLKQVVWNLLANAVKFTPDGGTVRVRILADRRDAVVEVSDDGEGIDDELLRHIFDRFTQGRDSIRKGGLGLGLSIARTSSAAATSSRAIFVGARVLG